MPIRQRVLLVPAVVAVFWQSVPVEAAGAAVIALVLGLNFMSGRARPATATP
jgi:hypothetical protein